MELDQQDNPQLEHLEIYQLLQAVVEKNASDLHLTAGSPPQLRIDGQLYPVKISRLRPKDVERLSYSVMNALQRKKFEETNELDMSFQWKGRSRFRVNFFRQRGSMAAAIRQIPSRIMTFEELGLPSVVNHFTERPNGLVLVTGPTGSGKSTTLASMIDYINVHRRGHIITVEDPIEYLHHHKHCIVNQREIGSDTANFQSALRYIMRQDPDVVLVGEIRDLETMTTTLRMAETGHLVFSTLHTNNTIQTISRVLDLFPLDQQTNIKSQLAFVLLGVLSQQLLPRADGHGRILSLEIMVATPAIKNLVREGKLHQIYSQMQMGQSKFNMQTMNQSLLKLVVDGVVTKEEAISRAYDLEEFKNMLERAGK